jgi:hypothetical protein
VSGEGPSENSGGRVTVCFKNRDRTEDWQPHYAGAVTLEDGQKFWANIWVKVDRNGHKFLSLNLKPKN